MNNRFWSWAARGAIRAALLLVMSLAVLLSAGCASFRVADYDDLCRILDQKPSWRIPLKNVEQRWQGDPALVMAFIHQESRFIADARADETLSKTEAVQAESAYGYAQAKLSTWDMYRGSSSNGSASRDNFYDAVDFIGWYNWQSHLELNIGLKKARELYLAYHEGRGGYERGSYETEEKDWLREVADKVQDRYRLYRRQYRSGCLKSVGKRRRVAPGR